MTASDGVGTLTFKAEAGAVSALKTELIGTATVQGTDITIKGALAAAEAAQATANKAVVANTTIAGATHTKITYDSKGLVTAGADLSASDIPSINHTKISDWKTEFAKKQDVLVFNTAYNAQTNKVATMADISDLNGVMHFLGVVSSAPSSSTITIGNKKVKAKTGDVVIVASTSKEYLYNGSSWLELGDEVLYAKKADTISYTNTDNGVTVTLGGTVSKPTVAVAVTDGAVSENNTSVVLGGTVYTAIESAKSAVVGTSSDTSTVKTIEGTRAYVDSVVVSKNIIADGASGETLVDATASGNKVFVSSTQKLKDAVTKADFAIQTIAVGTQIINKNNGTVELDTLRTDIGLGSAAYKDSTAFDAAGAASAVKTAVVGTSSDTSTVKTIEGTRAYVDAVVGIKNVDAAVAEGETLVSASASNNIVTVGSTEALQTAVANANSAVQSVTILGHELGDGESVTVEQVKNDLGLGSAAYQPTSAFDAAGAATAVKNKLVGTADDAATDLTLNGLKKAIEAKNVTADGASGETLVDATTSDNKVLVSSTQALKDAVTKANSAVQSITVGTQTINKTNGTVALATLKTDLGLGTAAYKSTSAFDAAGAATAVKTEVVGTSSDASTVLTLNGLKKAIEVKTVDADGVPVLSLSTCALLY